VSLFFDERARNLRTGRGGRHDFSLTFEHHIDYRVLLEIDFGNGVHVSLSSCRQASRGG
jgi:hypothetical protein